MVARELSESLNETVSVAIRQGTSVFYLAKIEPRALQVPSSIGQRLPASCTGIGKALLAELTDEQLAGMYPEPDALPVMTERSIATLPALLAELAETRKRGYAQEHGESTPGMHCVGAAVRDVEGNAVAAISTSVPESRWNRRTEQQWAERVLAAAGELSTQLGYREAG